MQNTNAYTPDELRMRTLMEQKQYARALEALAKIIKQKEVKPEFLYDGAYAYFMLGDYDRAAEWVTNTLTYAALSVKARILLARICLVKGRADDAMALLEFLLTKEADQMTDAYKDAIRMIGMTLARRDAERTRRDYPALAALALGAVKAQAAGGEDAKALLAKLKAKIAEAREARQAPPAVAPAMPAPASPMPAASAQTAETAPDAQAGSAESVQGAADAQEAARQAEEILARPIPAREKVRILNQFAGGCYAAGDAASAVTYLAAALRVDVADWTLRNMALAQAELGDREKALAFAARMKRTDFLLLAALRHA